MERLLALRRVLFFFQAEDGIRDSEVTGVQTCALPIYSSQAEDGIRDSEVTGVDRKSTRLNSSHLRISYAVFCLKTEEHTSERQSPQDRVCRLLLAKRVAHNCHYPPPTLIPPPLRVTLYSPPFFFPFFLKSGRPPKIPLFPSQAVFRF